MRSRNLPKCTCLIVTLAVMLMTAAVHAQDQFVFTTNIQEVVLDAVGNADIVSTSQPEDASAYQILKSRFPNPQTYARSLNRTSVRAVLEDVQVEFLDEARAVRITGKRLGAVSSRRRRWEINLGIPYEMVYDGGRTAIFSFSHPVPPKTVNTDIIKFTLPPGARDMRWDRAKQTFSYLLDRQPVSEGEARVDCDFEARRNIMSGLYKTYGQPEALNGLMWVARSVVRNSGDSDVTDIRIRYRPGELAPWSPESRYDLLPPGGVLVDCYYPLFSPPAMDVATAAPINVEMHITYKDGGNERHEDSFNELSNLLGRSSFETTFIPASDVLDWRDCYLNAPMLAAYATRADQVVRDFSSLISRNLPPSTGRESARGFEFCRLLYDQLAANGIVCRNPSGFLTEAGAGVIELKYPRDVLRERGGNVLELSALFAAACAAGGYATGFELTPGNCLTVIRLPEGGGVVVDLSLLGKGGDASFQDAMKSAQRIQAEANQKNISAIAVDIPGGQRNGIIPPELPSLPEDVLEAWGISFR